jgi:hypothetical protein
LVFLYTGSHSLYLNSKVTDQTPEENMRIASILSRRSLRIMGAALLGLFISSSMLLTVSAQTSSVGVGAKKPVESSKAKEERRRLERERTEKYRKSLTPEKIRQQQRGKTVVLPLVKYDTSQPLDELMKIQSRIGEKDGPRFEAHTEEVIEIPDDPSLVYAPAPIVEAFLQRAAAPTVLNPGASFEGPGTGIAGFTILGAPPDTTMAVGPNHIVAWVNSQFMIFNKTGVPQLPAPFFATGNTIWAGFGGVCQTTNRGDPLVAYDKAADRWIFSQFAFAVSGLNPVTPYRQCFAISTGPNPAGPYNRYEYSFDTAGAGGTPSFNDYGKIGIWNDAYYVGYNQFGGSPAGASTGAAMCAYDKVAMIAGAAADGLCAPITFYAAGASLFPFDNESHAPPTDTTRGGAFIRYGIGAVALRIMRLLPNFATDTVTITDGYGGAAGTFVNLPVGATTIACNGASGPCIPQPGTAQTLDTLADRLMYRPAFRNRGGVESLVVTHSVDPDGAGAQQAALRWYEIRNPLNNPLDPVIANRPTIFQSATFNPDATNRWMGSAAINADGSIFFGYSAGSAAIAPAIRVAGRQIGDPINTLQAEIVAQAGTGSQTAGLERWGDYTTAQVDPSDNRTFWFIGQYLTANGTFNWRTRIVSYAFPPPTAASAAVSGRILTPDGRAVASAVVTITDSSGAARRAITGPFGYYRFDDVRVGESYVISVTARRYQFTPRTVSVLDELTDVDFTAIQ